jgi:hypothetical protein
VVRLLFFSTGRRSSRPKSSQNASAGQRRACIRGSASVGARVGARCGAVRRRAPKLHTRGGAPDDAETHLQQPVKTTAARRAAAAEDDDADQRDEDHAPAAA